MRCRNHTAVGVCEKACCSARHAVRGLQPPCALRDPSPAAVRPQRCTTERWDQCLPPARRPDRPAPRHTGRRPPTVWTWATLVRHQSLPQRVSGYMKPLRAIQSSSRSSPTPCQIASTLCGSGQRLHTSCKGKGALQVTSGHACGSLRAMWPHCSRVVAVSRGGLHADSTLVLPSILIMRHTLNMRMLPSRSLSK